MLNDSSEACARELELIEATHSLGQLEIPLSSSASGNQILPIHVRMHPNRLSLIQQALTKNPGYYTSSGVILNTAKKLVGEESVPVQRIKSMIAESALGSNDVQVAFRMCKEIILAEESSEEAWPVSLRLVNHHQFASMLSKEAAVDSKILLLGHALQHCSIDRIDEALKLWNQAEIDRMEFDTKLAPSQDIGSSFTDKIVSSLYDQSRQSLSTDFYHSSEIYSVIPIQPSSNMGREIETLLRVSLFENSLPMTEYISRLGKLYIQSGSSLGLWYLLHLKNTVSHNSI